MTLQSILNYAKENGNDLDTTMNEHGHIYSHIVSPSIFLMSFNFWAAKCVTSFVLKKARKFFLISSFVLAWFSMKFMYQVKALFSECTGKMCNLFVIIGHVDCILHYFIDEPVSSRIFFSFIGRDMYWMMSRHFSRFSALLGVWLRSRRGTSRLCFDPN